MSGENKELQRLEDEKLKWQAMTIIFASIALFSLMDVFSNPNATGALMVLIIIGLFGGGFMTFVSISEAVSASDGIKTWKYYNEKWYCTKCGSTGFITTETGIEEPSLVDNGDDRLKHPTITHACAKCGAIIDSSKLQSTYRPIINSVRYACPKCGNRTFHYIIKNSAWLTASGWHENDDATMSLECTKCGFDATRDYIGLAKYVTYRLGIANDNSNLEEVRGRIESGEVKLAPIINDYYRIRALKDKEIEA